MNRIQKRSFVRLVKQRADLDKQPAIGTIGQVLARRGELVLVKWQGHSGPIAYSIEDVTNK